MEGKRDFFFRRQVISVAAVVGVLVCLSVAPMFASAALDPVIACTYAANGTPEKACMPDVYLGEHFTYACATGDTPLPTGANATGGKYCDTAFDDTSTACASVKTLAAKVGTATAASNIITVRVNHVWDPAFTDYIKFNVRCTKSGSHIYIAAKLWPFSKPLTEAPKKTCSAAVDTGSTAFNPCRFYIYQSDTAQTIDCRPTTGSMTLAPTDFYNGTSGNVCTEGLAPTGDPSCLNSTKDTWGNVVPGLTVATAHSNKGVTLTAGSLTAKRSEAYFGCFRTGGRFLYTRGWFFMSDFKALDKAHVPMIKHVCTPAKGSKVDTPCEVSLGADEAVVLQCAPYVTSATYTMVPDDTNTADGSFCTSKPPNFKDKCTETKKWKTDAYAAVSQDATLDYILVAHPKAMSEKLKAEVNAYGFCSDQTNGLAWKLTFAKGKSAPETPGGDSSGAASRFSSYVVLGAGTILIASFLAAAVA